MKTLDTYFQKDAQQWDTPKKLNRSERPVPEHVVADIEAGRFTYANMQELKRQFPVYTYRTCMTIHGSWPEVSRTRIGGYKNIHQNANGSLEVMWSACDTEAWKEVGNQLKAAGSKYSIQQDSRGRTLVSMKRITSETTAEQLKQIADDYISAAERVRGVNFIGSTHVYTAADVFSKFLVHATHLCMIPESEIRNFVRAVTGMDEEQLKAAEEETAREQARQRQETEDYLKEARERREQEAARLREIAAPMQVQIAHLQECNDPRTGTLIKVVQRRFSNEMEFRFTRCTGAGTFGRLKWEQAYSKTIPTDLAELKWEEQKQVKPDHWKGMKENRLFISQAPVQTKPISQREQCAMIPSTQGAIQVIEYSERAVAIFGDTKPIKDYLKSIGAKFNPYLKHNGETQPGWILPTSKKHLIK
jgi:hypothetical protein